MNRGFLATWRAYSLSIRPVLTLSAAPVSTNGSAARGRQPDPASAKSARARRAASELDEVGGTIGRAGQFAKRVGGLRSPRFAKKRKRNSKKNSLH